jgi:putative ABC transport system ATP-binding protein
MADDGWVDGAGVSVSARALSHTYRSPAGPLPVLDSVDLDIPAGRYCTLQGPSGSGKTTLLALLGGLERLQSGSLRIGDVDLSTLAGDDLAAYRRSTVGFVFQHFGLLETLTALENVEAAAMLAGMRPRVRRALGRDLLASVGLAERADHRPGQLSGGERQRVAMARALVNRPRLLLADEPTGNLDDESSLRVIELLERLHDQTGTTLVVVTHDGDLAARAPLRLTLTRRQVVRRDVA